MQYGHFQSDVDTSELTIKVKCATCHNVEDKTIIAEQLSDYLKNNDGTYTDRYSGECYSCLTGE